VWTFLTTILIACLALALFNYVVNPLNYYPPRLVRPLSYGDQLVKVDLMNRQAAGPDVLVLGSSRTMKLAPADVTALNGMTAFNGGVSSSRPEEWYAMLRHALDDLHWQPREIIVGVDLETLFYHGESNEDLLSSPDLRQHLPADMYRESLWNRAALLISWDQLLLSRKALALNRGARPPAAITFDPDGLLHYVGWEKAVAEGRFQFGVEFNIRDYRRRYDGLDGFDEQRKALFEQMLKLAAARSIRVRLFATTFHPAVLAEMVKLPAFNQVHADAVQYLSAAATRYQGVTFADFTEITSFGGDQDNFFDGVHIRQENGRRQLERLLQQ
jgi:hypothetical protein